MTNIASGVAVRVLETESLQTGNSAWARHYRPCGDMQRHYWQEPNMARFLASVLREPMEGQEE